jgi:hypothetical protein
MRTHALTAQAQTRFTCDRCRDHADTETANTPPASRVTAPTGWITLWIGDLLVAPNHLCPDCAIGFTNYLHAEQP